jgi:hypothetical protein
MIKNIRINECFGVFSQVRAFSSIESRFAEARTVFHQRRTADAAATLARGQGEASPREVARPMSRRQIRERRELSLPPPGSDWHPHIRHSGAISLDTPQTVCGLAPPVRYGLQQAPPCWPRKRVCKPPITPPGQAPGAPHTEVVDAGGFFASLVLRRLRTRDSSVSDRDCFSDHHKLNRVPAAVSEIRSPFTSRSGGPVTTAGADLPGPAVPPLETQLAELAWRRLRGRAVGERS